MAKSPALKTKNAPMRTLPYSAGKSVAKAADARARKVASKKK